MSTIGERVKAARQQHGMHQAELARRLGCSVNALSMLEKNAITDPRASRIIGIAKVLQVSADYLLGLQPGHPAAPAPEQRIGTVRNVTHEYAHLETFATPRPSPRKTTPVT